MTDKPAMPPALRSLALQAKEVHGQRFAPPKLDAVANGDSWVFACPYRDEDKGDWEALLFRCFATRSAGVVRVFLGQLSKLCGQEWCPDQSEMRPDLDELNAALAIVASTEPENESQAAMAAQMVALHLTSMKLGGIMGSMTAPDERTAATLARTAKAYATMARTLAQLQGKGGSRHDINVTYYDQRQQAFVMDRGQEIGGRPCATDYRTGQFEERPALPGPQSTHGQALSIASGAGKANLSPSRLGQRFRRAIGLG